MSAGTERVTTRAVRTLGRLGLALALLAPSVASLAQAPNEAAPNQPTPNQPAPNEATPDPAAPAPTPNEATPDPAAPAPTPNEPTPNEATPDPAAPALNEPTDPAAPPATPPSEPPDAPPPSTLPADHQPVIQVELTPNDGLMTGDVLTLTLRVTTPARDDVTIPRGQRFSPFEVLRRPTPRVEVQGDRATHVFELELLALEPGDHELPPVTLRVVTADGVVGEVSTAPLRVPVGSVLGNEPNAEPKPPTEPVEVWQDDYTLAWILGGLGLVLFGALFAWLFSRWWRRRAKAAAPPPPPRPAWEVALEKLEALRLDRDAAVREERVVAWVDQVSDALREYLGRRYEFDGLESTTDEVVAELRKRKLIGLSLDEVIALLRDCDLVKFAKAPLGVEQSDLLLAGAFRVVRTTAPTGGMSAMGPVGSIGTGGSGPSTPLAPREPDAAPTGDARWMGPVAGAPASSTPAASSSASPSSAASSSGGGAAPSFDPAAPWTPPGATPSPKPAPASSPSEWMPPRLDPTFEPRLDAQESAAPSSGGDVVAPAPVRPAVIPETRTFTPIDLEALEPAPIPVTRPPEPPELEAEVPHESPREPTREAPRPIPETLPPAEGPATLRQAGFPTLPGFAELKSPEAREPRDDEPDGEERS